MLVLLLMCSSTFSIPFLSDLSRKNSFDMGESSRESEFIVLKERKLISTSAVLNGTMRFAFLLETCPPGSVPDANLLASVLDLVSYDLIIFLSGIQFIFL